MDTLGPKAPPQLPALTPEQIEERLHLDSLNYGSWRTIAIFREEIEAGASEGRINSVEDVVGILTRLETLAERRYREGVL